MKQTFTRQEVIDLLKHIGKEECRGMEHHLNDWEKRLTYTHITKNVLRQWIIGAYCKSTGMELNITKESAIHAGKFADEVMQFLTDYKLLDKNIQP